METTLRLATRQTQRQLCRCELFRPCFCDVNRVNRVVGPEVEAPSLAADEVRMVFVDAQIIHGRGSVCQRDVFHRHFFEFLRHPQVSCSLLIFRPEYNLPANDQANPWEPTVPGESSMTHLRLALMALLLFSTTVVSAADFPLKQGDIWVMAGDSITAQHLHSNYFEAFCFARYPQIKFAFRNSGVGGHTITTTLARYDYDIDAWKPTVVSVELGMNDQGGNTPEQYIANMTKMVGRIRAGNALPVMLTASPINNGNTMANIGGNRRLHDYAVALKEFSEKEKLAFADQFHLLIDVWGANKPRENLANALPNLQAIAQNNEVAGVEHLRAFLLEQSKSPVKPVSMQGDPVHPGAPGQLMMAAALLKELGANPFVSSVTIDGVTPTSKGCVVENVKMENGVLSFDRLDESLPFPIPEEAAAVLPLFPTLTELSQYTLQVKSLKPGIYTLKVNGAPLSSTLSPQSLAAGVNLTELAYAPRPASIPASAIVVQARNVLNAVAAKEGLVGQWRGLSQRAHAAGAAPELKDQLSELTKKVMDADDRIREAAKPQKLHFELAPQQ